MKLENYEKCTYCEHYGNLPCEECDKKLEAKKAMSKTKYIKVEVSERLPQASGNYWITDTVGDMKHSFFNATLKSFPAYDFVEYWLEPIPDREDEMIEMLERIQNLKPLIQYPDDTKEEHEGEATAINSMLRDLDSLLQFLKQQ